MEKEFDLTPKKEKENGSFPEVTLSDGTVVKSEYSVGGDQKRISSVASKDGKEVARFSKNPGTDRIFLQVYPASKVPAEVAQKFCQLAIQVWQKVEQL